jgi:hypothetical protein
MSKNSNSNKLTVVQNTQPVPVITRHHFDQMIAQIDALVKANNRLANASEALESAVWNLEECLRRYNCYSHHVEHHKARALHALERAEQIQSITNWSEIERMLPKVRADLVHYHHPSMYNNGWHLKPEIIAAKVADMLGSFPNAGPHDPERYVPALIDEIIGHGDLAPVLECAIRHVVRQSKFPPSIAEMLKALKDQSSAWGDRWRVVDTLDENEEGDSLAYWREELPKNIIWAKNELAALLAPPAQDGSQ